MEKIEEREGEDEGERDRTIRRIGIKFAIKDKILDLFLRHYWLFS